MFKLIGFVVVYVVISPGLVIELNLFDGIKDEIELLIGHGRME